MSLDLYIASDKGEIPYNKEILLLNPLEYRIIEFIVKGPLLEGYIMSASVQVDSLVSTLDAKLSFDLSNPTDWKASDSLLLGDKESCSFFISIKNNFQTELKATLNINLELYQRDTISEISYHGHLDNVKTQKVLEDRLLIIDPLPEGTPYTYLKYSNGESLILLDDFSAIPYTPWEDEA